MGTENHIRGLRIPKWGLRIQKQEMIFENWGGKNNLDSEFQNRLKIENGGSKSHLPLSTDTMSKKEK